MSPPPETWRALEGGASPSRVSEGVAVVDGHKVPSILVDGLPPRYLWRVISGREWDNALRNGYMRSADSSMTYASPYPDYRYLDGPTPGQRVVKLTYDPGDGWVGQWGGDALYATTRYPIPLDRVVAVTPPGNAREILEHRTGSKTASDYRGQHAPPSDTPPLYDLEAVPHFPSGVYDELHFYTFGDTAREAERIIKQVRGNPNAMVTIYRSVPGLVYDRSGGGMKPVVPSTINTGDWVAITRGYAEQHGWDRGWEEWIPDDPNDFPGEGHWERHEKDWPVLTAQVPAHTLRSGGNDLIEWGYFGPPLNARVGSRGASSDPSSPYYHRADHLKELGVTEGQSVFRGIWLREGGLTPEGVLAAVGERVGNHWSVSFDVAQKFSREALGVEGTSAILESQGWDWGMVEREGAAMTRWEWEQEIPFESYNDIEVVAVWLPDGSDWVRHPVRAWKMAKSAATLGIAHTAGWVDLDVPEGVDLWLADKQGQEGPYLYLDTIKVAPELRRQGIGARVMEMVLDYADARGMIVALTPGDDYGTPKAFLKRWYGSMGFIPNTGRKADNSITGAMIRYPRGHRMATAVTSGVAVNRPGSWMDDSLFV